MIRVQVFNAHSRYRLGHRPVQRYIRRVLRTAKTREATISVVFLNSESTRTLNRKYLGHDYTTDVISFCLEDGTNLEGEVYVNLDRARTQARTYGVRFWNEVARLVIHGTLHLLGFDDRTPRLREEMQREEDGQMRFWFPYGRREERG